LSVRPEPACVEYHSGFQDFKDRVSCHTSYTNLEAFSGQNTLAYSSASKLVN